MTRVSPAYGFAHGLRVTRREDPVARTLAPQGVLGPGGAHQADPRVRGGAEQEMADFVRDGAAEQRREVEMPRIGQFLDTVDVDRRERAGAGVLLAALGRLERTRYVPRYHLALAHVGLGEIDAAFAALEQAVVDCDPALANLAVEPRFEPIRTDPRYARLIALLGLE
ncbi:MAG: hypothetical protein EXQ53_01760 [Acidobacteria bacterium]|nr:hypothetical protein [Acidobacteriota bacterium]